jgi:hypothetical protein
VSERTADPTPEATPPAITPAPVVPPVTPPTPPAAPTFSQEDVDRLVGKARDEGRKAALDEAKRKQAEDEAKAKGEWEQLAAARQAEVDRLTGELAARDRALLVARVAAKHRLPDALATRLVGQTEAELEADAKVLAKELAVQQAPDTEAGAGTGDRAHGPSGRPIPKKLDGPVYGFGGAPKVPWPDRAPPR